MASWGGSLWYPAVMRDERTRDRSSAWTRCSTNSPQGSGNEKNVKCAERKTEYLHFITKRGSTLRRVTVAQLLFGLAAHTRAERDESRGGDGSVKGPRT